MEIQSKIENKQFHDHNTLYAQELLDIVDTVNSIIHALLNFNPSNGNDLDTTHNPTYDEIAELIDTKISEFESEKERITGELEEAVGRLLTDIENLNLPDGSTTIDTDNQFLKALKLDIFTALLSMNLIRLKLDADGNPIPGEYEPSITLGMITEYDDKDVKDELTALRKKLSALEVLPDKIGLIAGLFEPIYETDANGNIIKYQVDEDNNFVLDDNGNKIPDPNGKPNVIDYKKITAAEIYAAINEDGSTAAGISADHILLDGETVFTDWLRGKNAMITDIVAGAILAGQITVSGTLNYGRLIGNIQTINRRDAAPFIANDTTYVRPVTDDPSLTWTIYFPVNPVEGLTIYIEHCKNVNVAVINDYTASNPILAGWDVVKETQVEGIGGVLETLYTIEWKAVEYDLSKIPFGLYPYNTNGSDYNLRGAYIHSYTFIGNRWVETTSLALYNKTFTKSEFRLYILGTSYVNDTTEGNSVIDNILDHFNS